MYSSVEYTPKNKERRALKLQYCTRLLVACFSFLASVPGMELQFTSGTRSEHYQGTYATYHCCLLLMQEDSNVRRMDNIMSHEMFH